MPSQGFQWTDFLRLLGLEHHGVSFENEVFFDTPPVHISQNSSKRKSGFVRGKDEEDQKYSTDDCTKYSLGVYLLRLAPLGPNHIMSIEIKLGKYLIL